MAVYSYIACMAVMRSFESEDIGGHVPACQPAGRWIERRRSRLQSHSAKVLTGITPPRKSSCSSPPCSKTLYARGLVCPIWFWIWDEKLNSNEESSETIMDVKFVMTMDSRKNARLPSA